MMRGYGRETNGSGSRPRCCAAALFRLGLPARMANPIPTIFHAFASGFAAFQSPLSLLEEGEDEGEGGELSLDPHPYPLPQVGEGAPCQVTPIYCRIGANSYRTNFFQSSSENQPARKGNRILARIRIKTIRGPKKGSSHMMTR